MLFLLFTLYLISAMGLLMWCLIDDLDVGRLRPALGRRLALIYLVPAEFMFIAVTLLFESMEEPKGSLQRVRDDALDYWDAVKGAWDGR